MRVRVRFSKLGKIRWTSHRDVARMWERAFRRVQLPLAYSSGYSPRPRVSFGLALPTGAESVAEYLDLDLAPAEPIVVPELPSLLSGALPVGLDATAAAELAPHSRSLQEDVTSCTWRWVAVPAEEDGRPLSETALADAVERVVSAAEVVVTRLRKGVAVTDDIRPALIDLRVLGPAGSGTALAGPEGGVWLQAELACQPRSLRPAEVLGALAAGLEERQTRRLHQWISRDGARREPLDAAAPAVATDAQHALVRAR
jgi:radical SAM-linked protein